MAENTNRTQARYLAELWHRLSAQHIALGCSCSFSGISVTLEDFERDIADYLCAESERLRAKDVLDFLLTTGAISDQDQPIRRILIRLADGEAEKSVELWLLSRLTKTIESYAKLHGPAVEAPMLGGSQTWRTGYRN